MILARVCVAAALLATIPWSAVAGLLTALAITLVEAIIAHEYAGYRYPEGVVNEGLRLAGIKVPVRSPARFRTAAGVSATGRGWQALPGSRRSRGSWGRRRRSSRTSPSMWTPRAGC